jgi:serine/threonine protein kinase
MNSQMTETMLDQLLKPFHVPITECKIHDSTVLGNGASGDVLSATKNDKEYAFKEIEAGSADEAMKIKKNLVLCFRLSHKHLVKLLSFDLEKRRGRTSFLLLMEKADTNLSSFLAKNPTYFDNADHVKQFMSQMLSVFSYFTLENVVHRDVKPANILIFNDHSAPALTFKVSDMASAKDESVKNTKQVTGIMGTADYMAPELKKSFLKPGEIINWKKCDVFSLGLVFLNICGIPVDGTLNEGDDQDAQKKINITVGKVKTKYENEPFISHIISCMLVANPESRPEFSTILLVYGSEMPFWRQTTITPEERTVTPEERTLDTLINELKEKEKIKSRVVEFIMKLVNRADFTNQNPYVDSPQQLGFKSTISAPNEHAFALELLEKHLVNGKKALDVGSGSGYITTCFAKMMTKKIRIQCPMELSIYLV